MAKIDEEEKRIDSEINKDVVGFEEKMQNSKKFYYITIGAVVVGLCVVFGILAGTGVI